MRTASLIVVGLVLLAFNCINCQELQCREPFNSTATENVTCSDEHHLRLPRSLKPLHYVVKLQPFINGNFSIFGYVEVEMEVLEATPNITLHMADIITTNDSVEVKEAGTKAPLGIGTLEYDPERQFLMIHLEESLQKGKTYVLTMGFLGYLNDQSYGFYRITYEDPKGYSRYLAVSHFEPAEARHAFPCFDEPALKATFDVYLARETWMTALSNMPVEETFPVEGQEGWVWDRFKKTVPMSTYLVAFVVTDFAHVNSTELDSVLFRVWAQPHEINQTEYARSIGPEVLSFYENYFGIPYPLPKMDMFPVPGFPRGAMENWGLITFRESKLLFEEGVTRPSNKEYMANTICHEMVHQWFGNLVTPKWWDFLWLSEGFATLLAGSAADHLDSSWKKMERFPVEEMGHALIADSLPSSHPICVPVADPDDIKEIFDHITYKKGASVLNMMLHFLTEPTFKKGLNAYLNDLKYKSAEQSDFWNHLTDASHKDASLPKEMDVKSVMDTWTLQMGYPVILVERSPDGASANISQERFLLIQNENSADTHDYKWWVPLTFTSKGDADFNHTQAMVWMKDTEENITMSSLPPKDQWVIFNLQQTGYYRVNYDDHNWRLIIQQLMEDFEVISIINRAQIIDDVVTLARAGHVHHNIALDLLVYLRNETEYLPWKSAGFSIDFLKILLKNTSAYSSLKKFVRSLVVPLYERLGGFTEDHEGDYLMKRLKNDAINLACRFGHQDCTYKALHLFLQWMAAPENKSIIPSELKSTVYCKAIAHSGQKEWDFMWQQYLRAQTESEKTQYLKALGCSKDLEILSKYLHLAFTPNSAIKKEASQSVFSAVASGTGRYLAWDFLRNNWNIMFTFSKKRRGEQLVKLVGRFKTREELDQLLHFLLDNTTDLSSNRRSAQKAVEIVESNIFFMESNYATIAQWLLNHGFASEEEVVA